MFGKYVCDIESSLLHLWAGKGKGVREEGGMEEFVTKLEGFFASLESLLTTGRIFYFLTTRRDGWLQQRKRNITRRRPPGG
jgi:hypothetical protein